MVVLINMHHISSMTVVSFVLLKLLCLLVNFEIVVILFCTTIVYMISALEICIVRKKGVQEHFLGIRLFSHFCV